MSRKKFWERQGLSQRKLALMAGSNQTHIWHIEDGSVSIGLDLLCRIADSLGQLDDEVEAAIMAQRAFLLGVAS